MEYKIYHNPRCSKSRETLKILQDKTPSIEVVEYLKDSPSVDELTKIIKLLNLAPEKLVRKGELIYKSNYKGKQLSNQEWIEAMVAHPKLIERPIVIKGEKAVIGRPPETVTSLF